ncbi:MAG: hypothetical protein IT581_15175 [Verrucomicrobiales bacterium]|nr:hypothetical protein [Verrucomicrobiales bacterium]
MILWIVFGVRHDHPAAPDAVQSGRTPRSHPVWGAFTEIQATDSASFLGLDPGPGILGWVNRQAVRLGWVKAGQPMPWNKPTPALLNLGGHSLEWSMRNSANGSGWLYFWDPNAWGPNGTRLSVWSFAPVEVSVLESLEASHLGRDFYGQTSDEWPSIFGVRKKRQFAIEVSKGQVLLARHQADANAVYVLEFTQSSNATVRVTYLRIPTTATPVGGAAP